MGTWGGNIKLCSRVPCICLSVLRTAALQLFYADTSLDIALLFDAAICIYTNTIYIFTSSNIFCLHLTIHFTQKNISSNPKKIFVRNF